VVIHIADPHLIANKWVCNLPVAPYSEERYITL